VLCCLEGKTHREAAASLGCAEGTVASRLSRARARLRARLVRRGLALSVAAVTTVLAEKAAPAAVAAALVEATAKAAMHFAAGGPAAAGVVSARAAALAKGALRTMWMTKLKTVAAAVLLVTLLGTGLGGLVYSTLNAAPPAGRDQPGAAAAGPAAADQELLNVPSQRDGVLLVVGTDIKEGEKVPADRVVEVTETYPYLEVPPGEKVPLDEQVKIEVGGENRQTKICRRLSGTDNPDARQVVIASRKRRLKVLKEGDEVQEGQLLAMVDPRLAVDDFLSKKAKVEAATADYMAAVKTRDEAEQRYLTAQRLVKSAAGHTISPQEIRGALLTWDRYKYEVVQKQEAIKQAASDLNQALTVLKMHEIRSPTGGVISRLYKRRGEAVKYLETVVQIRLAGSESPAVAGAKDKDLFDIPSPREGILLVIGTEVEKGKQVPPEQLFTVKIDGEEQKYRRLRVGDRVEEGQLLARLDDRLVRDDVTAKKAKVAAAEADLQASVRTRDEAEQRYLTIKKLLTGQHPGVISPDEVRGALLTWDRYKYEAVAKKADVDVAKVEVKSAQTVVEMYEVRSPARGVITRLYKRRGEAVKYLEPVVQIRVTDG
jgi:multidrug resistance efflux pump